MSKNRICEYEDCTRPHQAKGLCNLHYYRKKQGSDMDDPRGNHPKPKVKCSVDECKEFSFSLGYCSLHYQRSRIGKPLTQPRIIRSERHSDKWTKWRVRRDGYVIRTKSLDGQKYEQRQHRVVMEESLGRALEPGENVHHRNGNRQDNRIENLELWNTTQPSGQRVDEKLEWAISLIQQYRPELLI